MSKIKAVAAARLRTQQVLDENCILKTFALKIDRETAREQHNINQKIAQAQALIDKKVRLLRTLGTVNEQIQVMAQESLSPA